MNFYGLHWGYLKTSYFGWPAQWPLVATVCRGEPVKRPEAHINIAEGFLRGRDELTRK